MRVGYLRPVGTYCHEACKIYCNDGDEMEQYKNIRETIISVLLMQTDCCVVPIENSIEGSVNQTLDLILENEMLTIKAEIMLTINHSLLAAKKIQYKDIRAVYSHPQALAQCRKFIIENMPNAEIKETASTAAAAKEISNIDNAVAIASRLCAKEYNLEILEESIEDESNNQTRFIVLGLKAEDGPKKGKTSIILSTLNKPGALYKVLGLFNLFDINLTKIESRPARTKIGEYIFWIDFEGDKEEEQIKILLNCINKTCSYFRVLGSYNIVDKQL